MRRALDRLYDAAGILAAFFLVGTLAMVLTGIAGRMFGFYVRGTDAYAGYCMAACGFLALAHTLARGEHIRVTLLIQSLAPRARRTVEIGCHGAASLLAGFFAWYSARLAWQSWLFNDISTANDATPLWIPQLSMAAGAIVLAVAFVDRLLLHLLGGAAPAAVPDASAHVE